MNKFFQKLAHAYSSPRRPRFWSNVARIVLGAIFLIFGLDGYYSFLPLQGPTPEGAKFLNSLKETGYFFTFLKGTEILCGTLLIGNFFTPLIVAILTPVIINIVLYGIFLDPSTLLIDSVLVLCAGFLYYYYRDIFRVFFKYQYYQDPNKDGKKSHYLVLEEIQDKDPERFKQIMNLLGKHGDKIITVPVNKRS